MLLESPIEDEVEEVPDCVEIVNEPPMEEEQLPLPVLSLHAIKGLSGPHTMQFQAQVDSCIAIFLVDTRSTHNFLSTIMVSKLFISVSHQHQLRVAVADGRHLHTRGVCQGLKWEVQGELFSADFMVLPLKGCDTVLGIQ